MARTTPPPVNRSQEQSDVYAQRVVEAAFLWLLRSIAVDQSHYTVDEIAELEQRLTTELDELMSSNLGWQACEAALPPGEAGVVFTAMVMAVRNHANAKIQKVVEVGLANARASKGLISALGWLPGELVQPWIARFLNSKDLNHKYLGLAACSVRREDPGEQLNALLQREDCRSHAKLHGRALRLIGELRRQDMVPALQAAMGASEPTVAFWANWSAVLLGERAATQRLQSFAFHRGPFQTHAIQLCFRALPSKRAREWASKLATDSAQIRAVIQAIGVIGDPHAVKWLIGKMAEPLLARLAGEAFVYITGIDLEKYQLTRPATEGQLLIPDDNFNDAHLGIDEDENLLWPDKDKVAEFWHSHGQHFSVGQRYFLGKQIAADWLESKLAYGTQRQRHAAALELALFDPQERLINTRARVSR